ncbi:13721_t:CDS:2, partial [Entrophospora sp. SA101]
EKLSEEKESTDYNNNNNNSRLIRKHEKKISEKTVENILNKITKLDYDFEYLGEEVKSKENKFDKRIHKLERYIVDVGSKLIKEKQTEDVRDRSSIYSMNITPYGRRVLLHKHRLSSHSVG